MKIPSGIDPKNPAKSYSHDMASSEGWSLVRDGSSLRIEALPGSNFRDDAAAADHVLQRAWNGSASHEAAILMVRRACPEDPASAAYMRAAKAYLSEREEERSKCREAGHLHSLKALMRGNAAEAVRATWRALEWDILSRLTAQPAGAVAAQIRDKAVLGAAKDAYLLAVTRGAGLRKADEQVRAGFDLGAFMDARGIIIRVEEPERMLMFG